MFLNLTKELVKDKQEDAELPQQLPGASAQTGSDEMSMSSDTFTERDGTKLPPGFIPDLLQMQTVTDGLTELPIFFLCWKPHFTQPGTTKPINH